MENNSDSTRYVLRSLAKSLTLYAVTYNPPLSAIYRFVLESIKALYYDLIPSEGVGYNEDVYDIPARVIEGMKDADEILFREFNRFCPITSSDLSYMRKNLRHDVLCISLDFLRTAKHTHRSYMDLFREHGYLLGSCMDKWDDPNLDSYMRKEDREVERMLDKVFGFIPLYLR